MAIVYGLTNADTARRRLDRDAPAQTTAPREHHAHPRLAPPQPRRPRTRRARRPRAVRSHRRGPRLGLLPDYLRVQGLGHVVQAGPDPRLDRALRKGEVTGHLPVRPALEVGDAYRRAFVVGQLDELAADLFGHEERLHGLPHVGHPLETQVGLGPVAGST